MYESNIKFEFCYVLPNSRALRCISRRVKTAINKHQDRTTHIHSKTYWCIESTKHIKSTSHPGAASSLFRDLFHIPVKRLQKFVIYNISTLLAFVISFKVG